MKISSLVFWITIFFLIGISLAQVLEVYNDLQLGSGTSTETKVVKGLRIFYAGDITQVSTTSTTYTIKKTAVLIFNSSYGIRPRYVNVIVSLWNSDSGLTTYANISLKNCAWEEVSVTSTSETLKSVTLDVSSCPDGVYDLNLYLKTDSGGTAYSRLIDIWDVL